MLIYLWLLLVWAFHAQLFSQVYSQIYLEAIKIILEEIFCPCLDVLTGAMMNNYLKSLTFIALLYFHALKYCFR